MTRIAWNVVFLATLVSTVVASGTLATSHPFAFLSLGIPLGLAEHAKLEAGEALVEVLPAHGRDLAVVGVTRINVDGDRLVAWVREIEQMQRGRYVPAVRRFSHPPRIEDLSDLILDDDDLDDLRHCKPGDCGLKLSDSEIDRMQEVVDAAGSHWRQAAQTAFRRLMLARAAHYLAEGHVGTAPYHDQKSPVLLDAEFSLIASQVDLLDLEAPHLLTYFKLYPHIAAPDVKSFLYWSKDALGAKPIISITHVAVVKYTNPALPEALVVSKQVYATHYMTGSLALMAITGGGGGSERYLLYLHRSRADLLDRLFGGLIRGVIERRVRGEAPQVLQELRRRLESGNPVPQG